MRWLPDALLVLLALPAGAAERTVAVFDFELIDTSLDGELEGVDPAETARLHRLAPQLRDVIAAMPGFTLLDVTPVQAVASERSLTSCARCAIDLARELGADIVVTGTVQKVSNLILNINARGQEVATGRPVAGGSVDIRGNNDAMWERGGRALWKNRLRQQFEALE
jgi:hypothetical protein